MEKRYFVELPRDDKLDYPPAILEGLVYEDRLIILKPNDYPFKDGMTCYYNGFGEPLSNYQEINKKAESARYLESIDELIEVLNKFRMHKHKMHKHKTNHK